MEPENYSTTPAIVTSGRVNYWHSYWLLHSMGITIMSNPDKPPANQGDDELDTIFGKHIKDLPTGSHTTTFTSCDYCRSTLLAWHHRQLAERLQMILGNPLMQDEPNHYGGLDYTTKKEHRNELRHYIRKLITELMP
jgi:hypothetical protein